MARRTADQSGIICEEVWELPELKFKLDSRTIFYRAANQVQYGICMMEQ